MRDGAGACHGERASPISVPHQHGDFISLCILRGCHFTISHSSTSSGQGQSLGQIVLYICRNYKCRKGNLVGMLVSITLPLRMSLQYLVMYFKCHIKKDKGRFALPSSLSKSIYSEVSVQA